jgi:hypothetical protein
VAIGVAVIAWATLLPTPLNAVRAAGTPFWCLLCGELGTVDVTLNVVLFLPLGMGLRFLGCSFTRIAILSFLSSLAVESLQILVIAGRDGSLSDLLTNTIGGVFGGILVTRWRTFVFPTSREAYLLAVAGAAALVTVFIGTAALLQPALPMGNWYGFVAPQWPGFDSFAGEVLEARLGGIVIQGKPSPTPVEYRPGVLSGDSLLVKFVSGSGTSKGLSLLAVLSSASQETVVLLGRDGQDVSVGVRLQASAWRLRSPRIRLDRIIPENSRDTVIAWGGLKDGQLYAGAVVNERRHSRRLPLSVALGWALFLPIDWGLGPETRALNILWLGALVFPLAYWAALTQRCLALGLIGSLVLVAALVPPLFSLTYGGWSDWLTTGIAIAGGTTAAWYLRRKYPSLSDLWP